MSGSAWGAASRATTNPDDQMRTNRYGVARTASDESVMPGR
ncbi:hypothetical protein ACFPM0_19765 [Pseudonocardia sulfidoxydans]